MTSKVIRRYLAVILLMVMSNAFAESLPDSAASVNDFCQNAQQIIASTALESVNLTHSVDPSFIESSPAPYDNDPAGNLAAYNGKADPALLPLTTQQFVTYAEGMVDLKYPQVFSCKMKSSEAIQTFIDPSAAGPEMNCSDIISDTVDQVFARLPPWLRRFLAFDESEIVIEPDIVATTGPEWLDPFPPTVAFIGDDGLLHLQGKTLLVPVNPPPFIPIDDDKKGVHYCHLPAPSYLVRLVKGLAQP